MYRPDEYNIASVTRDIPSLCQDLAVVVIASHDSDFAFLDFLMRLVPILASDPTCRGWREVSGSDSEVGCDPHLRYR